MTYAEGGTISYANGKRIHTFEDSGTLVVTEAGTVEALVVAGGGAGGGDYSHTNTAFGGGGGGGVIPIPSLTVGLGNINVVVGEGGIPMLASPLSGGVIVDAENSSISDGNVNFTTQTAIRGGTYGQNGGSGGGGSGSNGTGGTGTVGQGNDGGDVTNFFTGAAGGGGAGAAGSSAPVVDFTDTAGSGGAGLLSSISGTALRYGAGGGGGAWQDGYGAGGLGGGGDGGANNEAGKAGTFYGAGGGGQGGSTGATRTGGAGHKGVVIFSYDSDFTTGRRVAENEDLADMAASTIKGRITTDGIPQDLNASEVAGILALEITERAQDAVGAMVADTATIDLTYTDATPELKADVRVDSINDTHIDWGTGANQVNLDDVPDGSTYVRITATNHTDLTDGGNTTLHTHGIYGLLSGTLAQFAATTSLELKGVISDETGTGALVFGTSPTLTAPVIGNFFYANHTHAASGVTGGTLASATGLPLTTGVTGILPAANGGTGIDNSTRTLTISTNAGTISFSAAASTLTIPATGQALVATVGATTVGRIPYYSTTTGSVTSTANFVFDGSKIAIGTATPDASYRATLEGAGLYVNFSTNGLFDSFTLRNVNTGTSAGVRAGIVSDKGTLYFEAFSAAYTVTNWQGKSGLLSGSTLNGLIIASPATIQFDSSNTAVSGFIFNPTDGSFIGNEAGNANGDFRYESDTEANMIFLDASADSVYFGGSTNGVKILKGGELSLIGTATVWDDLRISPDVKGTGAKDPAWTAWLGGVYLYDFDNATAGSEKELWFNVQLPHGWKEGTSVYPHVHWVNKTAGTAGHVVRWGLEYTVAKIGGTFPAVTTVYGTTIVGGGDITVANEHMITSFDPITMTGNTISTILSCRLFRNSSNAADTYTGTAGVLSIDWHFEIDKIGSSTEFA